MQAVGSHSKKYIMHCNQFDEVQDIEVQWTHFNPKSSCEKHLPNY